MRRLAILVIHRMPNRVRVKLSHPMKDTKKFFKLIQNNLKTLSFRYAKKTKTITINFDSSEILLQEIIYRIAIAFSKENGLLPVKLVDDFNYKSISPLSISALASIGLAGLNKALNSTDEKLQTSMNIVAMGLTSVSVLEHAYGEVKRKGIFDIEVLPAIYLLKNFILEQKISSILIMWLTTFARHLTISKNYSKIIKVYRIKNKEGYQYTAAVGEDNSIENTSDFIYQIFLKKNHPCYVTNERYITYSND